MTRKEIRRPLRTQPTSSKKRGTWRFFDQLNIIRRYVATTIGTCAGECSVLARWSGAGYKPTWDATSYPHRGRDRSSSRRCCARGHRSLRPKMAMRSQMHGTSNSYVISTLDPHYAFSFHGRILPDLSDARPCQGSDLTRGLRDFHHHENGLEDMARHQKAIRPRFAGAKLVK